MKRISLSLKLSAAFVSISAIALIQLYFGFSNLVEKRLLQVEQEKAHLIAETIEPMLGMNAYLGLHDELVTQLEQAAKNPQIVGLTAKLNGQTIWQKKRGIKAEDLEVTVPIKDPITGQAIGSIELQYASDNFLVAARETNRQILLQTGLLALGLLLFALFARILLRPLATIAEVVHAYTPGEKLVIPPLRKEAEIEAIAGAFNRMVDNVREYTALLERYKLSMDESSIVSRMDLEGRFTYVNDEFCRVSGYTRDELLYQPCEIMRSNTGPKGIDDEIWQTLRDGEIWKGTLTNQAKSGDDYYIKSTIVPIVDEDAAIIEYIAIQQDVTQIIQQSELIFRQTTDPLTGLSNRVKLLEDLKRMGGGKIALISIDNYNIIKDYYGFETSEKTLVALSKQLQQQVSGLPVTVYKLVASEFALLCDGAVQMSAFHATCRGIVETLEERPIDIDGEDFLLQLSAGLSGGGEQVLTNASLALQHAQENRLPAVIFEETENLIKHHENNLLWTKRIQAALNEDRITLHVQPIVPTANDAPAKYECLVRLVDSDGTVISPFHFLDVAKKSKLYHKISQRVIEMATGALHRLPHVHFSINLSPDDLMHDETMALLHARLQDRALASRVVLEIVESEEIEQFEQIADNLAQLKGLGCQIALDDFGTGYSNFSYLMRLNVDYIKVDGSLIRDIDTNPHSQIISRTIIDFAQALNLATVAEFVHNEAVRQRVVEMGFHYLQGYHLGAPIPMSTLLPS